MTPQQYVRLHAAYGVQWLRLRKVVGPTEARALVLGIKGSDYPWGPIWPTLGRRFWMKGRGVG